jgi:hypothetical protein
MRNSVHCAIVSSYLSATGLDHGLIINFAKRTLEIKRVGGFFNNLLGYRR